MKLRSRNLLRALVEAHREDGRSQRAIANRARITPSFLSQLLTGRKDTVTPAVATRLAGSLGIAPSVLFTPASSTAATRVAS